ncbi:hypothetical protein AL035_02035 [Salipiger aestuarii]|uniref:Uncharacterized protein n=1 Tax=Salipiger aestuarii TaxID=568098 RepID=A0A327YWK6_9RHOB|nr:hypothetical protein [Salipiger aestuarii]KAB2543268.1 hypothetical protein AL035_02035 [Salipiger aestuarii]RAK24075.1 hypothetical protein ATI53_1001182 [Salipiger aestuarii]
MTDTSTAAMMREAEMMDASDNHVWARKTRALAIERDNLSRDLAAAFDLCAQIADSHAAEARMNGDLTGATIAQQIVRDIRAMREQDDDNA